jgi:hypothetical protein
VIRLALTALVVLTVAACGNITQPPAPTPGSMDDVIAELVLRGASVHNPTSGDAGCPSAGLHDNAVRFDIALGTQSSTREVYLLRWRRQSDFDGTAQSFADCVAEYRALHPGVQVSTFELRPWRAYGPGWSPQLEQLLADALAAAGGG